MRALTSDSLCAYSARENGVFTSASSALDHGADAGLLRGSIGMGCDSGVLRPGAGQVANGDGAFQSPAGMNAGDDLAELGRRVARHEAGAAGGAQFAERSSLRDTI